MLLGSKPLSEMSNDEMLAAIEELRSKREALRAEAIAKKKRETETGVKEPKTPRVKTPKDDPLANIARMLLEDKDE